MMMACLIVCHVCQAIISYVLSAACQKNGDIKADTPWQINMEHQNGGLEDDFPFHLGDVQFHVNFQGCAV